MYINGSNHYLDQDITYKYYPDYMFPFPSQPPLHFNFSNAQCLLRTRKDILVVIDGGYHEKENISKVFHITNNGVSISLLKGKLELC